MNRSDSLVNLFRLERAFSAGFGVLITGIIVEGIDGLSLVHGYAVICVFFSAMANFVLNDIHDMAGDTVNERPDRPFVQGVIGKDTAIASVFLFGVLAVGLAFQLPRVSKTMILVGLPFTLAYNIYLKRFLLFKNLFTGFANTGVVMVGASITGAHFDPIVVFLAVLGFFFSVSYESMLDIADVEGDISNGISTIPARFGVEKGVLFSVLIGGGTAIVSPIPFLIEFDARLLHDPVFLILILATIADRLRIMWMLWEDQSPGNVLRLKKKLFRNLQFSGLGYLIGILI